MSQQSKLESWVETLFNVGSGVVISAVVISPLVYPRIDANDPSNYWTLTVIFTGVSILRGYVWRRFFNHRAWTRIVWSKVK